MHTRVAEEIAILRERYPELQHDEQFRWVMLPDVALPPGRFNKERTRLLFNIPPSYPSAGPDNFFVDGDLKLKDGSNPPGLNLGANSGSGSAAVEGNWSWFSWHPALWRATAILLDGDNLLTFVRGANMCLQGREAT